MKWSKLLSIWLVLVVLQAGAQQKKKHPVHVFITAGQSNTDGRVNNRLLPSYIKALTNDTFYNNGQYRFCKIVQNNTRGLFIPYWPKGRITDGL